MECLWPGRNVLHFRKKLGSTYGLWDLFTLVERPELEAGYLRLNSVEFKNVLDSQAHITPYAVVHNTRDHSVLLPL